MTDRSGEDTPAQPVGQEQVALAKLQMPRLAQGMARLRLFKILDQARQKTAVWIAAPGGAGKTTVVATYITERHLPYIWYQLDKDDVDPATFFYYLGLAAKSAATGRDVHLPLLTPEYLPDIPGFARRYFRDLFALLPPDAVLVLDNYQALGSAVLLNEILRIAINEVPPGYNIFFIGRSNPPAELARRQLYGYLEIIPWDVIRLTMEETAMIASSAGEKDQGLIHSLHERCEGWAAGLTLLLEHIKTKGPGGQGISMSALDTVFEFFADEFFDHLTQSTRDFLLKTSLLPYMTADLAEAVSGRHDAGEILKDFHRRHLFTNRRDAAEAVYQYHALFREFLVARLTRTYSRSGYETLVQRTAQLLTAHGWHTEAVSLLLHASQWETATPLILAQAPLVLSQGRAQLVASWIQQLPEEHIASEPWLLYWHGVSLQFTDPVQAKERLEQAYATFASEDDGVGQLLAASAIIDITYFLRWNLPSDAPWVEVLQDHLENKPASLSSAMEARILSSLIGMLDYMQPAEPRLPRYIERLESLLPVSGLDVNEKMLAAVRLISYYAEIYGNTGACDRILRYARTLLESPDLTMPNRFAWMIMSVLPYIFADSESEIVRDHVDTMLAVAKDGNLTRLFEEHDLPFLELIATCNTVFLHLRRGNLAAAESLLQRMEKLVKNSNSIDMAIFTMEKSMCAMAEGDMLSARKYGLLSLQAHDGAGAMLSRPEVSCILAVERCECGKPEEAFEYLEPLKMQGFHNSPRLLYQVSLIEAYIYLLQGDAGHCHNCLRVAFAVGRAHFYSGGVSWLWRILPRLCTEALRVDIESEYVQQLIFKRELIPEDPNLENWPWPIRIYTLGDFRLVIRGQPFDANRNRKYKPLLLLKVLVTLGGTNVKKEHIADILWPDAEADAALYAFNTTLRRLRKIVGENAVLLKDGRLSLNESICWCDVQAIESHFDEARKGRDDVTSRQHVVENVMGLYGGPFLRNEDAPWVGPLRDRIRSKLSQFVAMACRWVNESGEPERAMDMVNQAVSIDPDCKDYLEGLIAKDTRK